MRASQRAPPAQPKKTFAQCRICLCLRMPPPRTITTTPPTQVNALGVPTNPSAHPIALDSTGSSCNANVTVRGWMYLRTELNPAAEGGCTRV